MISNINEFKDFLSKCKRSLISLHISPDEDSLGVCTAMKYFLERDFNTEVTLVSRDSLGEVLGEIYFAKEVQFEKKIDNFDLSNYDSIFFLDSGSVTHFGLDKDFDFSKIRSVNIDHHFTNEIKADLNFVMRDYPSACLVLLHLFKEMNVEIDPELATRLSLGIYTDSGGFAFDNGRSLKDVAFLIDKGAEFNKKILEPIRFSVPLKIKKMFALGVEKFEQEKVLDYEVGFSLIAKEDVKSIGLNQTDVRGIINDLQEIKGIDIFLTLVETPEGVKGSFRTRKELDLSVIAQYLGGGGHKKACAFFLKEKSLLESKEIVFDAIRKNVDKIAIENT